MWGEIAGASGSYELRDSITAFEAVFDSENDDLRQKITIFWNISIGKLMSWPGPTPRQKSLVSKMNSKN